MAHEASRRSRSVVRSLQEYGRGIAGGLLFSLPLIYTQEMWQTGATIAPGRLLPYVLVTFGLLIGYNRYAGLRDDAGALEVVIDSVEEMGIGVVLAVCLLRLIGRIEPGMGLDQIVNQSVVEAMTAAIGVSVGTAQLGSSESNQVAGSEPPAQPAQPDQGGDDQGETGRSSSALPDQVVLALCGAILFAANVAPTEEILIIATEAATGEIIGIALLSLVVGAIALYFSDFRQARALLPAHDLASQLMGLVVTYAVALVASAMSLWFFGRFEDAGLIVCANLTVVLGFGAMLGASAGRLLLQ